MEIQFKCFVYENILDTATPVFITATYVNTTNIYKNSQYICMHYIYRYIVYSYEREMQYLIS